MSKGLFISFEGGDGCGKSTQISLFEEYCRNKGLDIVSTREPGGTDISEKIRELVLDPDNREMYSRTEALLYAASRAQHVEQKIKPALKAGKTVICDRFMDSSIVYQGYARGLGEGVKIINEFAVNGCMPDLTFFLKLDPEKGLSRVEQGRSGKDRLELAGSEFHSKVYDAYMILCETYRDRIIQIDASQSIEKVSQDIRTEFEKYISGKTE